MISDVYFPRINGVSTSIKTFRNKLIAQGHEVTLITPEYGPYDLSDGQLLRISSRAVPMDPEDRLMKSRAIKALEKRLKDERYDLVHIQTPFVAHRAGVGLARRLGIPVIESYHTYFEEYLYHYFPFLPKSFMRFAARWFTRRQCNKVDALVVPSRAMLEVLRDYGVSRPMEIIPTGIEDHYLNWSGATHFRDDYKIPQDRPVLVHIGRVAYEKNIDFLFKVLLEVRRALPEVLLVIAGEGPALEHLKSQARHLELENNLLFVGYLDRDTTLLECYLAGNAFVFASRTETQGLVLLEAMALGVPVVSTAVMGTRDILQPRKGAMVAEEHPEDFSRKIIKLLKDGQLQKSLGTEAREYAKTWSADEMALRMSAFYEQTMAQHRNSPSNEGR
jgi:glycosyltransferase involved in cell wall biosynthesis